MVVFFLCHKPGNNCIYFCSSLTHFVLVLFVPFFLLTQDVYLSFSFIYNLKLCCPFRVWFLNS